MQVRGKLEKPGKVKVWPLNRRDKTVNKELESEVIRAHRRQSARGRPGLRRGQGHSKVGKDLEMLPRP